MTTVLLATGGTLAWDGSTERMLTGEELARRAGVEFDSALDVESRPSWDLSAKDMEGIAGEVCNAVDSGANAVVVTHGTDTLEETAWLTDLSLGDRRDRASVVFTGGMRFADHEQPDGPANLLQAQQLAVATAGSSNGVQVSFAGEVHAARWARKMQVDGIEVFDSAGRPSVAPPRLLRRLELSSHASQFSRLEESCDPSCRPRCKASSWKVPAHATSRASTTAPCSRWSTGGRPWCWRRGRTTNLVPPAPTGGCTPAT